MAPIRKLGSGEGGAGATCCRRRCPSRLALLTALSVASALVYIFVLLVPAWRTVSVDRRLIGAFLANRSSGDDDARLWDALARDPLLRSRSANAFRECLAASSSADDGGDLNRTDTGASAGGRDRINKRLRWHATTKPTLERHLLELLAGFNVSVANATTTAMTSLSMSTKPFNRTTTKVATESMENSTSAVSPLTPRHEATTSTKISTTSPPGDGHGPRHHRRRPAVSSGDHCWFLNLHWSDSDAAASAQSGSHRALLRCTRALFLLAIGLLLCHCVALTGALYCCFASQMPRPCRLVLLLVHCLALSLLVALAILQDVSARLAGDRLRDLLAAAGFPDGCAAAVVASRGVCSLVLLCLLCLASGLHLLLLLLPMGAAGSRRDSGTSAGADKTEGGSGGAGANNAECDDTEETNPLIL